MNIASLRHQVVFNTVSLTSDGQGGNTETMTPVLTTWADVQPKSDREQVLGAQLQKRVTHLITVRWNASLTPHQRITWGTRSFRIRGMRNVDERNREWQIDAEEIV